MKIGFLIYSLGGGGAERVVTNLANSFVEKKHEVYIYIFDTSGKQTYNVDSRIIIRDCCVSNELSFASRFIKKIGILREFLKEDFVECLFVFMTSMIPYALLAKSRECVIIGSERENPKLHSKKADFIMKYISPFCDGFVFQTEGARKYYPPKLQAKSIIIQNPVFQPTTMKKKLDGIHFCAAGRAVKTKDFSTILKAFRLFHEFYPESDLTFFGNKEFEDYLKPQIRDLDLEENIIFRGFIKNLPNELTPYTAFLFSSRSEGLPNVLMEAMGAGVPCIATDCDFGPRELIENGENGILVPVGDSFFMAEAMKYVVEHPEKAMEMSSRAKMIRITNSMEKIATRFLDYIEEIKEN